MLDHVHRHGHDLHWPCFIVVPAKVHRHHKAVFDGHFLAYCDVEFVVYRRIAEVPRKVGIARKAGRGRRPQPSSPTSYISAAPIAKVGYLSKKKSQP